MDRNHTRAISYKATPKGIVAWIRRCNQWTFHTNPTKASRGRLTRLLASIPNRQIISDSIYTEINASYDK